MQTVYCVISILGLLCHYAIQCFACCTLPLQALEAEAARRLPWVVRLVQAEGRQRSLFASAAQLARTAAACCYASEVRRAILHAADRFDVAVQRQFGVLLNWPLASHPLTFVLHRPCPVTHAGH